MMNKILYRGGFGLTHNFYPGTGSEATGGC